MRSEEQWKDLKMKITVAVILIVVGGSVYAIGPGLSRFVDYARDHKTEKWAPKWFYNVGRLYEMTWREPKAKAVYEEFWKHYSGDERAIREIEVVWENCKYEGGVWSLCPNFAVKYPDREWVGGEGAKPDPLMADVLMRLSTMEEHSRNYGDARYYYQAVLQCFPSGTKAYGQAESAHKRDLARSF